MTSTTPQHWLVCYDIHNARQRQKANRLLRQFSLDYQESGLETRLEGDIQPTLAALQPLLTTDDRLLLLPRPQSQPDWRLGNPDSEDSHDTLIWA